MIIVAMIAASMLYGWRRIKIPVTESEKEELKLDLMAMTAAAFLLYLTLLHTAVPPRP